MSVTPYLASRTTPSKTRTAKRRRQHRVTPVTYHQHPPLTAAPTQEKNLREQRRSPLLARDLNTALPVKLQAMMLLHRGASTITCCLVTAALAAYGWTVYIPTIWSHEYRELESLQRHERQLTETNEALKNQLARQAERSGLVQSNPSQSIFLTPTVAPEQPQSSQLETVKPTLLPVSSPIAY